ncbi:DNA-binding HxlR family transcriptional regulator [Hydrogenophaga laconesensis]|uniref:DNA-binding HxlR family transcriptional regulator n=1 Tax=Hydrogenophaga laconesensis TaxID=1805971 RepID=A0ABU1VGE9_9BURK|nr:DNA-binding HxlR family transcriptional regulator [Hydrogenophaga laconesensis]
MRTGKRRIPPRLIVVAKTTKTAGDTDSKCATCEAVQQLRHEQASQQLPAALQQGQESAEQAAPSDQLTTLAKRAEVEAAQTPLAPLNVPLPPAPGAVPEQVSDECAEYADVDASLDSIDIEDFLTHPHWERMDEELHRLVEHVPQTSQRCERTTILSWLYQREGVSTFTMLADRIRGIESQIMRKRAMRRTLRTMERLNLVSVITFAESNKLTDKQNEELGRNSMITLTWTGMVWMRRAWQARANLARNQHSILQAHEMLVAEEEEGRGDEPIWVEGLAGVTPEEAKTSVRAITIGRGHITSVFDLGMKR